MKLYTRIFTMLKGAKREKYLCRIKLLDSIFHLCKHIDELQVSYCVKIPFAKLSIKTSFTALNMYFFIKYLKKDSELILRIH